MVEVMRKVTDARFEVISGPRQRYELPRWFKTTMLLAASAFMLFATFWRAVDRHEATAPPVGAVVAAETETPQ